MRQRRCTTRRSRTSPHTSCPSCCKQPVLRLVCDIATGTGLSAQAALAVVGPTGHVSAADISPSMVAKTRDRLGDAPNVSVSVEDGQALSFPDGSFDAVLCSLGLMFFPAPAQG